MASSEDTFVYGVGGPGLAGNRSGAMGVLIMIAAFIVVLGLSFLPLVILLVVYPGGGPDRGPLLAGLTANWPLLAVGALVLVIVFPMIRLPVEIARLILRAYVGERPKVVPVAYSQMSPYRVVNWAALAPASTLTREQMAMLHLMPHVITELVVIGVPLLLGSIAVWFACAVSGLNLYMLARKLGLMLWVGRQPGGKVYQESKPGVVRAI